MTTSLGWLLIVLAGYFTESVIGGETCQDPDRLIVCHIESELHPSTDPCSCTHLVIHKPHDAEVIKAAGKLREKNHRLKILSLSQEGKKNLLEDGVSGVYLKLSKSLSKELVIKNVKALATELDNLQASKRANAKYSSESPDSASKDVAEIILELPSSPEQLAKNYDLKSLNKYVNYFIISSDNLTDVTEDGLAYHPSRLMGIDDILNTDSLVDLISGLGAEHEKLLVSLPATALKFNLKDPKDNMPRAKVTGPPKSISQKELCSLIENGVWTLERDEDLTAPYAFSDTTWLAFDDSVSASIKAKYILLRGLAGIAITKSEADDWDHVCASRPILDTIYSTFTNLVRKPRAATLLSLQDQIHNSISPFAGDIQLSPYRIVRVVDRAGSVHVVRKEAKTEFQCSRQGYFTHPSGCNRFYRCVKFNQYSSDFTVFEYDCPAGLAFDERYEVCVWPGSLPDASACKGSSEIAPVPRSRYACSAQGYFADPENCRWFFACLDHHGDGRAPTAYEFRCPFGLVFNEKTLTCDWPWSVPGCGGGSGSVIHTSSIYPGDILEGRLRPAYAQVSDLHVSGGRIADVDGGLVLGTNLLSGISTSGQRYSSGYGYGLANPINSGLGNTQYEDNSGAYIHDPTGDTGGEYVHEEGPQGPHGKGSLYSAGHASYGISSSIANGNGGQYVHDSRGDNADQYIHSDGSHGSGSHSSSGASGGYYAGDKVLVSGGSGVDNSGAYIHDSRGDNAGQYVHSEGSLGTGSYISSGISGGSQAGGKVLVSGSSVLDNAGAYLHDSRGDSGGQYVHSEGLQGTVSHSSSGASGGYYAGGKVLVSGGSGLDNSGAYVHDSRGDNAGQYVHSEGLLGTGSYISSGVSGGYHAGDKVLVSGGSVADNSGAYVHDSRGDNAGQYIHSEGSQGTGLYSSSGLSSGYYAGSKVLVSGGSGLDNSGAYIHDSRGDAGGAYVHQDGPEGPGSKPYLHSGSSSIKYGNAYEHGETGYVHQIGTSSTSSVIYSSTKSSGSDFSGPSGAQLTTDLHQSEIHRQQASFGSKAPNTLLSGAYIHDSRGDSGGAYLHQEGSSGAGSIPYIQQGGVVKTNQLYSTDYVGNGGFSGGSYGGNSGQYIHDSTGDKGGEYIHQEGPSGPGPVPYVHQEGTNAESGQGDGLKIYKTNYVGQNIVGLGGFSSGSLNNIYNSGQYIHDSRGDTGGDYVHQDGPSYYQGLYAGRYVGNYIHDNSGSYVHDSSGHYNQPYVHQAGPSRPLGPLYQGVDIYNSQYAGQYASKYATDQKHLINYGSTNLGGATHLYQPGGVIHTYDTSRLHVQPLGYKESVLRPVNIAKFSGVPLNPVQYSSHALPISVTTPRPAILTEIQSHTIQPITVTEKPIVPLNPVQYITPLKGIKTNDLQSLSLIKGSVAGKPISVNPVQYHQETTVSNGFSGYDYSKPKITFSYPEHIIKHQYAVQPTPATYLTGYSYHPSVPVQSVKTVISQPVLKTNVASPVFVTSTPRPDQISFKEPSIVSHIVKPVSVTSSPIVPLNPAQYGTKVETIQVSTPAPPPLIYNQPYNPVIKTQTVRPIIVSSTPAVPLSPVQYGTKVQTYVGSTPAPLQLPIHSYNPVIKTQTLHPVIVSSTPAVPLNPVQYGIKTISSSAGYHYSKPIVGLSYPKGVYSTQAPPVISYTYQKPLVKTQPIQPIVSTPALPDVSISHEIPLHQISIPNPPSSYGYSYQQPTKPVSVSTPAPPVVSYSYQQPIKHVSIAVSTPAPPVVSYSSTPRPIIVSSTPTVPLNPIQYINPISINTPAPPRFGYSYSKPLKPLVPVSVSTQSPPVVSYSYQQPIKPAVNIAVSTPAPPVVSYSYRQPVKPVAIGSPAPAVISYSTTPRPIIVSSTPSVPLNPVQYVNPISTPVQPAFGYSYKRPVVPVSVSTPAPPVVSYSYQQPIKHVPIAVSTPAPPVVSYSTTLRPIQQISVSSTPVVPLNPVQYVNPVSLSNPVQPTFGYSYSKPLKPLVPVSVSTPSPPIVSYSYQQPIKPAVNIAVSTPAPPVVSYSYRQPVKPVSIGSPSPAVISYSTTPRPIIVSSTPSVPLNPVQYVNPISTPVQPAFGYSYKRPVVPVSVSTPAPPVVSYSYQQPIKHAPIAVSTPAPPVVSYSTTLRPIQPISVSSTPAVPLNPVQYVNPVPLSTPVQPSFGYSYKRPLKPVIPVSVSTPAPAVVSYSYQQPIKPAVPIRVSTPAPPVVSYSTTLKPIQPILVSSTPTVPLNPVQYFNHISPSTPAPPPLGYSYKQSAKPISFNVPISTSGPPLVSYSYKQQVPVYKPAPAVEFSYQEPLKPDIHYQAPLKPIAPIHSYSYENPTTPAPPVIVSTPAPFRTQSHPIQHIKQVTPINVYSYKQTLAPVTVDSPARPSFTYSQPAPFSTSAPAILNYSYNAKGVVVSSTPTVPLNPVQYVKQVTTPIPSISYSYKRPFEQSVVNKGTNTVFSYTFDSKPIQPITVSSTPAIPLNPVQYSVTPAPAVTLRPVSTYSTPSVPVINYSYNQPSIKPITNRPLRPAIVTTHAPEVSYSYTEPDYFLKLKTARPVSVASTPVVPLNPVQYVSTTPRPIINYQYQNPIIKTHTSIVAPSIDYYNEEELHREITKIKPKPAVGSFYEVPTQTTTLAPITVTSTPVIPLNPVQYVKHPQPVFSYTYNSAQSEAYNTKGCCSSSSIKVSSTPKPIVLKTTAYPPTVISAKKPVVGAYFEENYEANRQEEGYVYSRPNIKFEETPLVKGIYSTSPPYNNPPKITTSTYLQRPVQTYANTVEEESYISNTPEHVTTLVKQPISVDTNDEDLNLHLDIPKIGVNRPVYTTTNTPQQQIVEVTTVTPVVKRVKVKGGLTRGGYYVRRQKVKVQPVITTTENYPAYFTSTIKPIYSSTIDLSSPTLYSSTVRPSTVYTTTSTTLKDDELEVEDEDYDSKLLEQVSGQFGEIINAGNQGIIRQGVSSTTVSSLKDGETIVGVVKKERVAGGRNKAKVVVVSKLSDFNPLLVGKLGAECSCKSNSKTLNLQRGSSGSRGQLFYPEVQNVRVPSREYLPTSSEPPKVNDYYLPTSEVPFISAKASTTEAPGSYDDQSYVEIRPINKVQKFYTSTGPTLDNSNIEYDATTKRSITINKVGINQVKTLEKGASFDRYGPGGLRGSDETLQGSVDCQRAGLFRHPKYCNKFYACNWDEWKKRFTLHVFNCPIHLAYDSQLGACNWPSKGPACADDNLLV